MKTSHKIRKIREQYGESMEAFGLRFNQPASGSLVSRWERGVNLPNAKRLSEIAELGETTVEDLLSRTTLENYTEKELLEELLRRYMMKSERKADL